MITFSATVQALFASGSVGAFYAVDIVSSTAAIWKRVTSHSNSVTLSNGKTYVSDGTLLSVQPPRMSTSVDREQYQMAFADPDFIEGPNADYGLIGHSVEIRLCFLDNTTGQPLTNIADTFLVYAGKVDTTGYKINVGELGEAVLQVTCSSPMADLDYKKALITSRDFVRSRNPSDVSFDMVYGGSGVLQLKWGKS